MIFHDSPHYSIRGSTKNLAQKGAPLSQPPLITHIAPVWACLCFRDERDAAVRGRLPLLL